VALQTNSIFSCLKRLRVSVLMPPKNFSSFGSLKSGILPISFCFPGWGASGDLPPSRRCAPAWRESLLGHLRGVELTLVFGRYAHAYHLPDARASVTENVGAWRAHWPRTAVLPHPSPRNNRWLDRNPWFETDVLPVLQQRLPEILTSA
jgi:uracil-DNA glycosylase